MNFCDKTITVTPRKCQCYPYLIPVILEAFRVSETCSYNQIQTFSSLSSFASHALEIKLYNIVWMRKTDQLRKEGAERSPETTVLIGDSLLNFFEEQIPSTNLMSRALCMSQNFSSFFQFQPKYSASRTELEYMNQHIKREHVQPNRPQNGYNIISQGISKMRKKIKYTF